MTYGFHGDSSLYLKTQCGNRSSFKGDQAKALWPSTITVWKPLAGAGVSDITASILSTDACDIMGISIFGNKPVTDAELVALYGAVRSKSAKIVFFVGGFASKYGLPEEYDARMDFCRASLTGLGAVVFAGHNEVDRWPLQDGLHFSSVMKKELVNFWVSILQKAGTLGESMDTAEEDAVDEEPVSAAAATVSQPGTAYASPASASASAFRSALLARVRAQENAKQEPASAATASVS